MDTTKELAELKEKLTQATNELATRNEWWLTARANERALEVRVERLQEALTAALRALAMTQEQLDAAEERRAV